MNEKVINKICNENGISTTVVRKVLQMLSEGSTIAFIARYRKEVTNNLNEDDLRKIESEYKYKVNLDNRVETIKKLLSEKELLTIEIENALDSCEKLSEVEEIYAPFKDKRVTKGTLAIKMGLEGLANEIMTFSGDESIADKYLNDEVKTREEAFINAGYIIADRISDNIKYRTWIKDYIYNTGFVLCNKKKNSVDEKKVYEMYYDYKEKIKYMKGYRTLAIARAEKEKIITYKIDANKEVLITYLNKEVIHNKEFRLKKYVESYIEDALKRLIFPSIERSIKNDLFEKAEDIAIKEFGNNLEHLLLTPPIKEMVVMGFDPAFRTGCKLAILSPEGQCMEIGVIYPHEPKKDIEGSKKTMLDLIRKHDVKIIAIGNGTASRESEAFVSTLIKENNLNVKYIIVSEAGASVYSASSIAKKEFPDFSVEQRSAVSIGRRLQDALSELVKIDPSSIGVGLYQHDVNQKQLEEELSFVTSKIVNNVGVNINNASEKILSYVSGLNKKIIKAILDYKKKKGKIKSRKELLDIKSIDSKIYEQCAGFLRIIDGENILDKTNIHPEDYELVYSILDENKISYDLIGKEDIFSHLDKIDYKKYNLSDEKIEFIKENLKGGIIDPRDDMPSAVLKNNILTLDDLTVGDLIEGTVRNVTSFGAFIDIGLHDDALIHISKMSKDFIKHPSEVLSVNMIVNAYIDSIDKDKERVSLSLIK